jgi:branched-chain amino acid transport system permease protein
MTSPTLMPRRLTALWQQQEVRRLVGCLLTGLLVAVMTGPSGSESEPTAGIRGSLLDSRVFLYLGLGLAVWLLLTVRERYRERIRAATGAVSAARSRVLGDPRIRYAVYALILLIAIFYPRTLSPYWQRVLVDQIGIYVLLALGLNVVVGFAGLLDLGYIAFYAIGAYTAAYFTGALPVVPPFTLNPFFVLPLAVLAAMLSGVIIGGPTLRLRGDYLAIVTLGFGEIIQIVAVNLQGITGGAQGRIGIPHFSVHALGIDYDWTLDSLPYYYLLLVFVAISMIAFHLLENSRVGRAWTAIREDEVAAEACGINALKYKIMAFAIGASTSGFAGVMFASKIGFISPQSFLFTASILVLVLVIFGGMGSIWGAVVGAAVLQWVPQALRGRITAQDLFIYFGALLVVMMIFRPEGLLPSRRRQREFGLAEAGVGGADAMGAPSRSPTP